METISEEEGQGGRIKLICEKEKERMRKINRYVNRER